MKVFPLLSSWLLEKTTGEVLSLLEYTYVEHWLTERIGKSLRYGYRMPRML